LAIERVATVLGPETVHSSAARVVLHRPRIGVGGGWTAQVDEARHPVVGAVLGLRSELTSLSQTPVWGLSTSDTEAALLEVTALATQVS